MVRKQNNIQYIFSFDVASLLYHSPSIYYLYILSIRLPPMAFHSSHTCPPSQNTQTHMEETQDLPRIESFSNDWITQLKKLNKFLDSPGDSLRFSIDLEACRSISSMHSTKRSSREFNFDLPRSGPIDVSIADHMICNGSLIPLNLIQQQTYEKENNADSQNPSLMHSHSFDESTIHRTLHHNASPDDPISPNFSQTCSPTDNLLSSKSSKPLSASRRMAFSSEGPVKPSKRIMSKCFKSLVKFCRKFKGLRLDVRRVSPRTNDDTAVNTMSGCSTPLDDEASREAAIKDAIMYCKSSSRRGLVNL